MRGPSSPVRCTPHTRRTAPATVMPMPKTPTAEERKAATKARIQAQILKDMEAERNRRTSREAAAKRRAKAGVKPRAKKGDKSNAKKRPPASTERDYPICGTKRSRKNATDPDNPGVCTLKAGWGTDHLGFGTCKWHGGTSEKHTKHAIKQKVASELAEFKTEQIYTMGGEVDIDPTTALSQEVRRTAGCVHWIGERVRELHESEVTMMGPQGPIVNPWIKLYQEERDRLINVSKVALGAGIAERQVRLAEEQGRMIATLIMAVLLDKDLHLTPEQRHVSKAIVRKHMMTMDIIDVPSVETPKELVPA